MCCFCCGGARPGGGFFWKVSLTTWFVKQHYFHVCVFCWWFRARCINSIFITWRKTNRLRWSESWCLLSEMVTSSVWRRFRGSLSIFFSLSVCVSCLLFLHVIGVQIAEMNYAWTAIWQRDKSFKVTEDQRVPRYIGSGPASLMPLTLVKNYLPSVPREQSAVVYEIEISFGSDKLFHLPPDPPTWFRFKEEAK